MDEDKTSAELIGDIVSDFFSKAVVEPISVVNAEISSLVGDTPPPPPPQVLRETLTAHLTSKAPGRHRVPRLPKHVKKEERRRMEAALMSQGVPSEAPRERSASDSSGSSPPIEISSNTTVSQLSVSPPETPADPLLRMLSPADRHSPSPELECSPETSNVRPRASSTGEKQVVRRRAKSKEERQAEEMDLMKEFRRRDLSTWLSPAGVDDELADGSPTEVDFVPYSPFVKSKPFSAGIAD